MSSDGYAPEFFRDAVLFSRRYAIEQDRVKGQADGFAYLFSSDTPNKWEFLGPLTQGRKLMVNGGTGIEWNTVYREYGSEQFVLPGKIYQPAIVNVGAQGSAPWRHAHLDYSFLRDEILTNRGKEKLAPIIRMRRTAAFMGMAKMIEAEWWADPSSTSDVQPLTQSYWAVPILGLQVTDSNTAVGTFGSNKWGAFQGGLPNNGDSYTSVGGMDPGGVYTGVTSGFASETYARHRNWNFTLSNTNGKITQTDCQNIGHAMDALDIDIPYIVPELTKAPYTMQRILTCQVIKDSFEQLAREGNDSTGLDVAKYQNQTVFRSLPLRRIKALDTASTTYRGIHPIYINNWAHGHIVVREGEDFLEQTFGPDKYLPDMTTTEVDFTYQFVVSNRQQFAFIGSYVAAS